MIRRLFLIGAGVVGAFILIIGTLYYLGGKNGHGGFFERVAKGVTSVTHSVMPSENMGAAPEFAFHRLEIDTTKAQPEACLVFTRALDVSGKTHYEDYLSVDPATRIVVHPIDTRLCIAGFSFNQTYNLTLKPGLPDAAGEKIVESETIPVELRDAPSLVRFSGGIILPRDNADGVPVTTVNIDRLKVKLIRVGDRLLSQIEAGTVDETTLYSYSSTDLEQSQGSVVWQGTMDVANVKNASVVTLIPIRDMLKDEKPGAYVLIAMDAAKVKTNDTGDEDDSEEAATQWVVDSDIALTTFQGQQSGLTVFTRSYASAKPKGEVKLTLVARNNNILSTATTNSEGRADFDAGFFNGKGGDEPVVVMAYDGSDFSFLDLRRPAFDLTDRGVGGREVPGPVDAYLYTERGIYRPGETIKAVAMLRNSIGASVTSSPLTLIAKRPDGVEFSRVTIPASALVAGAANWSLALRKTSPHGRWQIAAYIDPKAETIGRVEFNVADFIPQRLKVALTPEEKVLHPNSDFHIKAESRFLYGAPASGLSGDGTATITRDPDPFPEFTLYQFGRVDDTFSDVNVDMTVPESDAAGVTEATGTIGDIAQTTLPLKASVKISIHEPGGRTTDKAVDIPLRTRDVSIGLLPAFQDGSVPENAPATFEAIAVNGDGKRIALTGVTFTWVREVTNYQWYQDSGSWKYQAVTRDRLITSGTINLGTGAPLKLTQQVPWGTYRLTLTDQKSGAASSFRFYSGWAASAEGDRPDRIPVAANKPSYKPGETAHVSIKPQAEGKALVVVAGDKIYSSEVIDVPANGASVDVPVSADWGAGAYVLVTDYRPLNEASGREPVRSIGVAWLGVDNSARTLTPLIGGPARITPRQHIVIPVTVKGLESGEDAYITLAAVDEGILQLTDFKSPDPNLYYFGKRRLGLGMHDDYGRLIKVEKGPIGAIRSGGDSFGGRPLAVVPTQTVALFSGIVKVGAGGLAQIPLDIPDFNGELRLMVVAFTDNKLGHADRPLTVRDPIVADIVLPRFLAPGDHADAALNMNNVDGGNGSYTATVVTMGPLGFAAGAQQDVVTRPLNRGQRILVPIPLEARGLGIAGVRLTVTGPGGFKVSRGWPIQIRAAQLDVANEEVAPLAAGQTYRADGKLIASVIPSTTTVAINVSSAHGYSDVPGLLRWLDKYPYGCIEQTTSRALPLLYFNDLAPLAGLPKDKALHDRIQEAVDNVLDMQNFAGNFGMWGPGNDADNWISVFALDFLYQAKQKGFVVPNEALKRGAGWMKQQATSDSNDDQIRAYAFYVLAREGQANLSDLRYFSDTRGSEWNNAIAAALTGAAASQAGDRSRATYAFGRARSILADARTDTYTNADYGSLLRDLAGTTALAIEGGDPEIVPALMEKAGEVDMRLSYTTTQEKAWMLRAAYELTRERSTLNIVVNGAPQQPKDGAVRLSPTIPVLNAGLNILNRGDAGVWRDVSIQGTPNAPLPPEGNGLSVKKTIWTMAGQPADLMALKQNDRVIVVIEGEMNSATYRQMGVIDLLPAGLEIEMPLTAADSKPYPWLSTLTDTTMEDSRDDRFVSSFNIGSQYQPKPDPKKPPPPLPSFRIAYIARAVTTGRFTLPAAVAEDMYAPAIHARTDLGTVTVGP